jgi:ATP-dependent Clp protease protease subunit
MKTDKDQNQEALFNYIVEGLDLDNRVIYFNSLTEEPTNMGVICYSTTERIIRAIKYFELKDPTKPITLVVSSYGGEIYSTFALVDAIKASPCKIIFKGTGMIASGGTVLCAVCDERHLTPNCIFMIHAGSNYGGTENHIDSQIESKQSEKIRQTLYSIYEEHSFLSQGKIEELCARDVYLSAQEALTLGFADYIIPPLDRPEIPRTSDELAIRELLAEIDTRVLKKTSSEVLNTKSKRKII